VGGGGALSGGAGRGPERGREKAGDQSSMVMRGRGCGVNDCGVVAGGGLLGVMVC